MNTTVTSENAPSAAPAVERQGNWPATCRQRAFVEGAKWWQFHSTGCTAFSSERDKMEAEAVRRFGDPMEAAPEEEEDAEELAQFTTGSAPLNQLLEVAFMLGSGGGGHDLGMMFLDSLTEVMDLIKKPRHPSVHVRRRPRLGRNGSGRFR